MDEKRICDYFVITGIPPNDRSAIDEYASQDNKFCPFTSLSPALAPITDIIVIIPSQGEITPKGYYCIDTTPLGFSADLNHGSLRSPSIFLCYKRGNDKPPLVDIGVLYEAKERVKHDSEIVKNTYYGRPANVNNGTSKTYLTFRRAKDKFPCNQLVVIDICVILANKGETPPHAFCLIERNLNKGLLGSDVFICYKKSMNRPPLIRYQPRILGRFPLTDYSCYSLPEQVPLFCMPMGFTIECWPKLVQQPRPTFSTFVLTSNTAVKVYGAVITFFEKFNDYLLKDEERRVLGYLTKEDRHNSSLHSSKSICILSRWPFFDTFEKFLNFLHRIACCTYTPQNISIERYISHFMLDVPFPSVQRPKILVQLGHASDKAALISQPPEDMPLPLSGASFSQFLRTLGSEKCITVFLLVLTEQKILLHSLRPDLLTSVAEALTSLIFPFHWQCPYIPLCPLSLSLDVLNAPLPFIVGVDSRYFDISEPPADVACVDLDTNSIYISEQKRLLNIKLLPKRPTRLLKNTLDKLYKRLSSPQYMQNGNAYNSSSKSCHSSSPFSNEIIAAKKQERQIDLEIQEIFVRFMASILKSFRSYLRPITKASTVEATETDSLFDFQGFLKSRDKAHQRFYHFLMKTQMFTRFIEERSFVSDKDTSLAFFDECLDKIEVCDFENALDLTFLDVNKTSQNDRTVFIPAPEPNSSETFIYTHFGPLVEKNFHKHPSLLKQLNLDCPDAENLSRSDTCPILESPMSQRTKQEIRSAQRIAKRHAEAPLTWAKCLVSYCYSLWFIHFPAYVVATQTMVLKIKQLKLAFDVLLRMQSLNLHPPDEVCYRVLMLLCGVYSQPILAVKILFEMKRSGVIPNAITYGYYNKAILESKGLSSESTASQTWKKLKNVVSAISRLKKHSKLTNIQNEIWEGKQENHQNEEKILSEHNSLIIPQSLDHNHSDISYCSSVNNNEKELNNSMNSFNDDSNQFLTEIDKKDLFQVNKIQIRTKSIVRNSSSSLSCFEDYNSLDGVLMVYQCSDSLLSKGHNVSSRKRHRSTDQVLNLSISPLTSNKPDSMTCSPRSSHFNSAGFANDAKIIQNIENKVENCKYLQSESKNNNLNSVKVNNLEENENCKKVSEIQKNHSKVNSIRLSSCSEQSKEDILSNSNQSISIEKTEVKPNNLPVNAISNDNQESESNSTHKNLSIGSSDTPFTPIKDAIINMNIFSPEGKMASTLRSSFRFANRFALGGSFSKNSSISKSLTFHSNPSNITREKFNNKLGSFFKFRNDSTNSLSTKKSIEKSDTFLFTPSFERANESQEDVNNVNLPDNFQSNFKSSTEEIKSQQNHNENACLWTSKLTSGKHLEYVNSTIKSAANTMANRITEFKNTITSSATNSPSKMFKNQNPNFTSGSGSFLSQWASLVADKLPSNFNIDEDESNSFSSLDFKRLSIAASEDDISERSREGSLSRNLGGVGYNQTINIPPLFDSIDQHYHTDLNDTVSSNIILEIEITSCCKCNNCFAVLYDEEIMEFWSSDDSNLNTQCSFCSTKFVPLLTITLKYRRFSSSEMFTSDCENNDNDLSNQSYQEQSTNFAESKDLSHVQECDKEASENKPEKKKNQSVKMSTFDSNEMEFDIFEPFTVPYLSPIVLRKEFENVLESEGDTCLIKPEFADEHPIIYWNLIWYFKRINLPSHIIGLCLQSSLLKNKKNFDENRAFDNKNVRIYCLWDNHRLHHDCEKPMYYLWKESTSHSTLLHALVTDDPKITHNLMRQILKSIQCNDMISAMKLLVNERTKHDSLNVNRKHYSMYRDLLYLSFTALGRENIDQTTFDREYRRAYEALTPKEQSLVTIVDKPPSLRAIFCRRIFKELELKST